MVTKTRILPWMIPPPRLVPTPEMVQLAHEVHEALQEAKAKGFWSYTSEETLAEWFAKFAQRGICTRQVDVFRIDCLMLEYSNATEELCRQFVRMCGYIKTRDGYRPLSNRFY